MRRTNGTAAFACAFASGDGDSSEADETAASEGGVDSGEADAGEEAAGATGATGVDGAFEGVCAAVDALFENARLCRNAQEKKESRLSTTFFSNANQRLIVFSFFKTQR